MSLQYPNMNADGTKADDAESAAVVAGKDKDGNQTYVTTDPGQSGTSGSSFTVKDGTWANVLGAWSGLDSATLNTVTITAGTIKNNVYGGRASDNADNNKVTISGVSIGDSSSSSFHNVYGGYADQGTASENIVALTNVTANTVYGGYACNGPGKVANVANSNEVTITGGVIKGNVYGGYNNNNGTANSNIVKISNVNLSSGEVYGGMSQEGSASYNVVEILNSKVNAVCGGNVATSSLFTNSEASYNTVTVNGDTTEISNVYGAYSKGSGNMTNNKVIISGGEITVDVYGSMGDETATGSIENNEVIITGGKIEKNVYGSISTGSGAMGNNNTVTLGDKDNKEKFANITGTVYLQAKNYEDAALGGILNVYNCGNIIGGSLYATGTEGNPSTLNFYINSTDMNQDEESNSMLHVTGRANITGATIKAGIRNVGSVKKGDKITLLEAGGLDLTPEDKLKTGLLTDGFMEADLKIEKDGNTIIAYAGKDAVAGLSGGGSAKSPVETMAASVTLLNSGADMVAGESFGNAAAAVAGSQADGSSSTMAPFASIGGSSLRVESGSYCDVKTWNINLGMAKEITNKQGRLMFGPIIEYGHGSYDSYLDNGTHGKGNSSFTGIGFMAKQSNTDGLYYEGSLRGGRAKSDYKAIIAGNAVSYDTAAPYYAVHVGVGKVQPVGKGEDTLDYYGKLFYSRQNGDRASMSNGYDYDFKAVDSLRSRLGLRYNHKVNAMSTIYGGLAWQHEFDGKAEATGINTLSGDTFETPAPSVKGDTGILELGWKVKPGKGSFETGLGFTGSVGKQKGVGLNASFQWSF